MGRKAHNKSGGLSARGPRQARQNVSPSPTAYQHPPTHSPVSRPGAVSPSQKNTTSGTLLCPSPRRRRRLFLLLALLFHLVYAFSIFDVYFVSPIVNGMRHHALPGPAPAKRLVLVVADGLRADKAFQSFPDPSPEPEDPSPDLPRPLMPFIRSKALQHGTFGVSHTRVPTESRPGHVALIAGLYEDVSSVTTGWKLNPVNFDSVFNRSSHTWSWGSPDILPMFKEGAVPGRIDAETYNAEAEDFTANSTWLDTWVFDRVKKLFVEDAVADPELNTALHQDKVVFFLHLLGLDTAGHAYRPYSAEYLTNIKVVDAGVRQTVELINEFYGDNRTAFVFTADHGMSDWGSHGDGHPDNTRTPLVAWGAGVAGPVTNTDGTVALGHQDGFSHDWNLDHVQRNDVFQADIAPLMAYLIGAAFPANSVGELPISYLEGSQKQRASALLVNAKQILEMYKVKEAQKRRSKIRFVPYSHLSGGQAGPAARVDGIESLIARGLHSEAIDEAKNVIRISLDGLRYLQTYDWLFLRTVGTLGYVGWIVYALLTLVHMNLPASESTSKIPSRPDEEALVKKSQSIFSFPTDVIVTLSFLAVIFSILAAQDSPWRYYGYVAFPVFFWHQAWALRLHLPLGLQSLFGAVPLPRRIARLILYMTFLEALVYSYFERRIYTLVYFIGALWPLFLSGKIEDISEAVTAARWSVSCVLMGVFTLLPAMKEESLSLLMLGGSIMLLIGLVHLRFQTRIQARSNLEQVHRCLLGARVGMIALAMVATWSSVTSLQARQGLPLGTQVVGWITQVGSIVVLPTLSAIVGRKLVSTPASQPHRSSPFLLQKMREIQQQDQSPVLGTNQSPLATKSDGSNWYSIRPTVADSFMSVAQLAEIFVTFSPSFVILSISYEGLFYIAFFALLTSWVDFEKQLRCKSDNPAQEKNRPLSQASPLSSTKKIPQLAPLHPKLENSLVPDDFRVALFFLFLIQSAFFSTGNLASVSSFSLDAVYRLIPVFDPFSQGALLMLKLMIPYVGLSGAVKLIDNNRSLAIEENSCPHHRAQQKQNVSIPSEETKSDNKAAPGFGRRSVSFMAVIALADVLTLHFFWLVRDEGSWLDIGTTISHFVIAELLGLFVVGLEVVSGFVV